MDTIGNRRRSQQPRQRHRRPTALLAIALAAATCTIAIAACGSSGNSSRTGASANPQLAFAECMRTHGVPNFPDPSAGGGIPTRSRNRPRSYQPRKSAAASSGRAAARMAGYRRARGSACCTTRSACARTASPTTPTRTSPATAPTTSDRHPASIPTPRRSNARQARAGAHDRSVARGAERLSAPTAFAALPGQPKSSVAPSRTLLTGGLARSWSSGGFLYVLGWPWQTRPGPWGRCMMEQDGVR